MMGLADRNDSCVSDDLTQRWKALKVRIGQRRVHRTRIQVMSMVLRPSLKLLSDRAAAFAWWSFVFARLPARTGKGQVGDGYDVPSVHSRILSKGNPSVICAGFIVCVYRPSVQPQATRGNFCDSNYSLAWFDGCNAVLGGDALRYLSGHGL